MASREAQAKTTQEIIRRVLLRDWDPIGVRDTPEAQDEYDGYVGPVYQHLARGASVHEIADYLAAVERDAMRLPEVGTDLVKVAERLKQIEITSRPA
jgi:hypothetical protein